MILTQLILDEIALVLQGPFLREMGHGRLEFQEKLEAFAR
jgi:hypothetical protein